MLGFLGQPNLVCFSDRLGQGLQELTQHRGQGGGDGGEPAGGELAEVGDKVGEGVGVPVERRQRLLTRRGSSSHRRSRLGRRLVGCGELANPSELADQAKDVGVRPSPEPTALRL
jgi:hypothetical protein